MSMRFAGKFVLGLKVLFVCLLGYSTYWVYTNFNWFVFLLFLGGCLGLLLGWFSDWLKKEDVVKDEGKHPYDFDELFLGVLHSELSVTDIRQISNELSVHDIRRSQLLGRLMQYSESVHIACRSEKSDIVRQRSQLSQDLYDEIFEEYGDLLSQEVVNEVNYYYEKLYELALSKTDIITS